MGQIFWADSFDHYGTGATTGPTNMGRGVWAQLGNNSIASTNGARTGTNYLSMGSESGLNAIRARRSIGEARTQVGVGYGIRYPTLPNNLDENKGLRLGDVANNSLYTLTVQTDGSIGIYTLGGPDTGSLLGSSAPAVIVANTWHHIEWIVVISTTLGSFSVQVDGVSVLHLDNLNTGSTAITQVEWMDLAGSNDVRNHHLDDVICHDGSEFLGPVRVLTLFPAADSTPQDWTVTGAATAAEAVDEATPDDDTSYIGAPIINDLATFEMPELPADLIELVGVYIPILARQEEAGTTTLQVSIITDGLTVAGPSLALTPSYNYKQSVFQEDPSQSGLPWTKEQFETSILQIERTE